MPCSLCGNAGHNRRRCQRWDMLIATRIQESNLNNVSTPVINRLPGQPQLTLEITPIEHTNDITSIPSTPSSPSTPTTIFPRALFRDTSSIPVDLWSDSDDDDTPLDFSLLYNSNSDTQNVKQISHNKPLVEIAEHPCHTNDCPICMDDLLQTDLFVTRCGHQFHGTCMIRHIKHNDTCPMCRGVLFASSCAS